MSTLAAIQKTLDSQKEGNSVKLSPNSADTSFTASREEGVLIEASNATVKNTGEAGAITIKGGEPHRASIDGGDITIQGGHQPITASAHQGGDVNILGGDGYLGGSILIAGGDNTNTNASSITGTIAIQTGGADLTSDQHTGNILVNTGNVSADGKGSGQLDIKTGTTTTGNSGAITMRSGTTTTGSSGDVRLQSGIPSDTGASGVALLSSGDTASGQSGQAFLYSGASATDASGQVYVFSSNAGTTSGAVTIRSGSASGGGSGNIEIYSGTGTTGTGGITIYTGAPTNGSSGNIGVYTSDTSTGSSGEVGIYTGQSTGATGASGPIYVSTGNSDASSGSGEIGFNSGNTTNGATGNAYLYSGNATGGASGQLDIKTGTSNVTSGNLHLETGNATGGSSGQLDIKTGTTDGSNSGIITITTGNNASGTSGGVGIYSGTGTTGTGDINIKTGFTPEDTKTSGAILIATGGPLAQPSASDLASSGDLTITTGNTYDVASGQVYIKTGYSMTSSTGGISIQPGDGGDGAGNLTLQGGDTNSGMGGTVYINGGECVDPNIDAWGVQIKGSPHTKTGLEYINISTQIIGSDVTFTDNWPSFTKTVRGGDVVIKGGGVIKSLDGVPTTLETQDDDTGTQSLGEVKVISGSVPTSTQTHRLMMVQADGVLKSSPVGYQILGHGELIYTPDTTGFIHKLPIGFLGTRDNPVQTTIGSAGADYYPTNNDTSSPRYDEVSEWYEGVEIIDHNTAITGAMSTDANAQSGEPYYKHEVNPWGSAVFTEEVSGTFGGIATNYFVARKLRIQINYYSTSVVPDVWRVQTKQYAYGIPTLSPTVGLLHQGISSGGWFGWTCEVMWRQPGLSTTDGPGIYNGVTQSPVHVTYLVYQVD